MPVPKATTDNSPRRLLRDVVFDKLLEAIQNGTLQPGERLNDDELVQWLGVSRTPIREAIARLVEYGLVEMEANRFTRIASPTAQEYDEAYQMLFGFTELAARWAMPKLTDGDVADFSDLLDDIRAHAGAEDRAVIGDVTKVIAYLVLKADNALLSKLAESLTARAQFVTLGAPEFVFWDVAQSVDALRAAAKGRDGEAGGAVIRALGRAMKEHLAEIRAAAATAPAPAE